MFLNDINARVGELDAELEGIAALADPTDDDVARTEAILTERDELRKQAIAAQERTQRRKLISAAREHVSNSARVGNQLRAFRVKVPVAEPAMILSPRIDDPPHPLGRHLPNRTVDCRSNP